MHSTSTGSAPASVEWSLLTASLRALVVLNHSPGRSPVRLLAIAPVVTWRRADGGLECLEGDERALARMQREIMGRGLLVGEYSRESVLDTLPVDAWLLLPDKGAQHG